MRGARRYQDLIVWQLADQIRVQVFKLTARECFARDLKLHSQTEDAVNSVCRNIAEGFACKHKEFARFLEISRRSLNELGDSFRAAQLKRYVTAHDYEPIWQLTHRLYPAFARLIRYLQTTPDPDFSRRTRVRTEHVRTDRKLTRTDPQPHRTDPEPPRTDPKPHSTDPEPHRTDPEPHRTTD
jgi:four helix bundle protein